MSTATEAALGTHSEVGKLRTVMVHRPDLAHERLSPSNCHELLFDDVIWVRRARQEFDAFTDLMRSRGVEVVLVHQLLAEALEDPAARDWLLSRRVRPEDVTVMFADAAQGMAERDARGRAGDQADRRPDRARVSRGDAEGDRPGPAPDRFRPGTAAEPAVHARYERLAVRRGVAQPDVLAGTPARDAERRGDLPLPSSLPRRRHRDLVRRRRPRLGHGAHGGRRHDAGR